MAAKINQRYFISISKTIKIAIIAHVFLILNGCSILPGFQGPETSKNLSHTTASPLIVPITANFLSTQSDNTYYYRIAPSDVLAISVFQHPEFNFPQSNSSLSTAASNQGAAGQSGYLVNPNGEIYFPYIGTIPVANKTVDEIRVQVANLLKKYVPNPQVNVRVADFRGQKIFVLGEVVRPTNIPLNDQPLSITDALMQAGSIDPNAADPKHIFVMRGNIMRPTIYWLDAKSSDALLLGEHFYLKPGDILYISSAPAAQWNRLLNQILPTLSSVYYVRTLRN